MTVRHRPTDHVVAKTGLGFVIAGERQYDKQGNGETGEGAHSIYSGTKELVGGFFACGKDSHHPLSRVWA